MNARRQRIVVHYSGSVQGVGFRHAARQVAQGFEVCGTVRNLADGRVQLTLEGDADELDAFRKALRDAGVGPLIRGETVDHETPRGDLRGFQIVP